MEKIDYIFNENWEIVKKFNCEMCKDTMVVEKIEWCGTDTSYPVEYSCPKCIIL